MPRKIIYCFMLILCSSMLLGCNRVIDLTEEETSLIAEYTAELLLKYDRNYTDRIDDGESALLELQETSSEEILQEDTQTTTEEKNAEVMREDSSVKETEVSISNEENLAKVAEIEGIAINYKDYLITNQYPATDGQGDFIYLDAAEGYQLLVLRFKVANVTDEPIAVSLLDKEIDYRVVCNGGVAAKPMLTILLNDLVTLETTVNPSKEQEAVLVFQVAKDMESNFNSIEFKMSYNAIENSITILE